MCVYKQQMKKRFKPYFAEALYSAIIWTVILILYLLLILYAKKNYIVEEPKVFFSGIMLIYWTGFVIEFFFSWYVPLLAFVDLIFKNTVNETVKIKYNKAVLSTSAPNFTSILIKFYNIDKIKLYCETANHKKLKIRTTTDVFQETDLVNAEIEKKELNIVYGKYSKILLECSIMQNHKNGGYNNDRSKN